LAQVLLGAGSEPTPEEIAEVQLALRASWLDGWNARARLYRIRQR